MKYLAAYALLVLGGNDAPTDVDVKRVLEAVGVTTEDE